MRSMKSQAELARAQRRERQVKYWLAWVPITSAILTSVYLLLDAIGIVPMQWEKWLTFALFSLTFLTLARPTRDIRDTLFKRTRPHG